MTSLLYVANLGAIPLHMWPSRVGTLELPDWCVLDLDPKGAPFTDVVRVALAVHELCETIGLPALRQDHRLDRAARADPAGAPDHLRAVATLGELLARVVVARAAGDRDHRAPRCSGATGKVYLDYLQNAPRTAASWRRSACARCRARRCRCRSPGDEVNESLDLKAFTIKTALERMKRMGDSMAPLLTDKPDLLSALSELQEIG